MEQRRLGTSDLVVGRIAFGCWRFAGADIATAVERLTTALDAGVTLVDTADIYGRGSVGFGGAEELLGRALAAEPGLRDRMVLTTKGGIWPGVPYDSSEMYLRAACEASLGRLGLEQVDLYQIHRPDLLTHPAEVALALSKLVASGKVRHVGVSNHSAAQFAALQEHLSVPLVTTQPEFHLLRLDPMDDGIFDQAMQHDVTPLVWSPLAGGRLASPDCDGHPELAIALDELAAHHEVDRTVIALAAVLAHPSSPVAIIGTQEPARIQLQARAADIALTRAEVYRLMSAAGRRLP